MAAINGRRGLWLRKSPGYDPPCYCGGFGEAQIAGTVSQKPLTTKRWGKCFINVPPHPKFPPLPLCHFVLLRNPHTSRFAPTHAAARQPPSRSERWRQRGELRTRRERAQRKQVPEPIMTKSGRHRTWEKWSSRDWWWWACFLTASPPDGSQPVVSPSQCLTPMKL